MPSILRSRIALVVLLASFLIPIGLSSLRGLTHVLTCEDDVETPFSLLIPAEGPPVITTSTRIERRESPRLCGGLAVNLQAQVDRSGRVAMTIPITNKSSSPWQGTVQLHLADTSIPVSIGRIEPGETGSDTVTFELDPGTHELSGSLLIGP